jgi:signal transduction histidine kinase
MPLSELGDAASIRAPRRVAVSFGALIALLVLSAAVSGFNAKNVLDNNRWVLHSMNVRQSLSDVMADVVNAESTQRNFLLTGFESFLVEYRQRRESATRRVDLVASLSSDNPRQAKAVDRLEILVDQKFDLMEQMIDRRRALKRLLPAEIVKAGVQRAKIDEIKRVVADMQAEENLLLRIRSRQTGESIWRVQASFLTGTCLALAVVTTYFLSLRSFLLHQRDARFALEAALVARVKAEEGEQRVLAELWRSNRDLQDFAFVASHDLQEPLRKILAFGDRLRIKAKPQLGEEGQEYLDRMLNAASRMQRLIDDLLTLSRVSSNARPLTDVNLNRTLDDIRETFEHRTEAANARLTVGLLPTIRADASQMNQLFQNLVGNALKFSKTGRPLEITVSAEPFGENHVISVVDNGIGFDPQFSEKIFTVFQRLHGRGDYEGSGIGLSICRKIVERHGGTIRATSRPDEGATFTISLPVAA